MDKKSGFSFLEILIVMMIVGILFVAFRSSFQIKNKDTLYGQACIETIYGQVNNFLHAGLSSKSISSGSIVIFPDQYIISFVPDQQRIELLYQEQGSIYIYSSIEITGNISSNYCTSNGYTIELSGDTYELHINKGLQENQAMQFFYISGTNVISTGGTIFLQCDTQGTGCKTMARFESDTRTIQLKKYMCLSFSGTDCLEWDN
ncbi:MAG: type II secretion system protein [candidate division SR1 bacterium]|nr:type II secretion system protein [candidate division SR1 bacterium]